MRCKSNLICPKCGKTGFITGRWIRKDYYAWNSASPDFDKDKGKVIGEERYALYMGHYDKDANRKSTIDYKSGRRKSRPNGRTWCMLRPRRDYEEILMQPTLRWFKLNLLQRTSTGDAEPNNLKVVFKSTLLVEGTPRLSQTVNFLLHQYIMAIYFLLIKEILVCLNIIISSVFRY
jgi:hypothetical protein